MEGTHKHKCPNCSFVWEHENNCVNNTKAHTCRKCGTEQWSWDHHSEKAEFISCAAMPMDPLRRMPTIVDFLNAFGGKI